ncbi:hypothetical protein Ddye_000684 [Dipteronia dyeriana]|uniref:Uncharacterized protein n=1 Tax=Dipteronia dyeriana TaxID=168575 RepID=A0AAE0CSL3_9ROSI|nr:hypothetical protein Ddye_000684 [Dipteronia dyeriana]
MTLMCWRHLIVFQSRLRTRTFLEKHVLHDIMTTCIIMHNIIIEDERDVDATIEDQMEAPTPDVERAVYENTQSQEFLARHRQIKDK